MLWIDLRVNQKSLTAKSQLQEFFRLGDCGYTQSIAAELKHGKPDVLCLEYDYPDRSGLRLFQDLKAKYPSIPIVVVTTQHSEELAVWAFRSGALDYFAKPIPYEDLERCCARVEKIRDLKRRQLSPRENLGRVSLPLEAAPVHIGGKGSLAPAEHYISQHFREKISRDEAASLCSMSPFRFSREFKEVYGIPFRDYVVRFRIQEACRLLENPAGSVTSAAMAVGFNDVGYFSRMFKQLMSMSPSQFKKQGLAFRNSGVGVAMAQGQFNLEEIEDTGERLQSLPALPLM
jgi:YesN/AraC family two-component response regulator